MSNDREAALYNLLYALKCTDHLYEARFYVACLAEALAIPERHRERHATHILSARHSVADDIKHLFKEAGLELDVGVYLGQEGVQKCIRKVRREIAKEKKKLTPGA